MHILQTTVSRISVWLLLVLVYPAQALEFGTLTIWINSDKSHNGMRELGQRFTDDTGVPVTVLTQDDWSEEGDPAARFTRFATTTEAPDIIFWAHDRFGSWINEGLLLPVEPSPELRSEVYDFAWSAMTVGDQVFGYPISMEAISLIYNPNLIESPPRTWADVIELDKALRPEGKRAIAWAYRTPYFTWPLVTSAGGYSFKKIDQAYDLTEVGVDNRGAIEGIQMLRTLMAEGVIEETDDYGRMMDAFTSGEAAMIINGPWACNDIRQSGTPFELARFPAVSESAGAGRPFVGFLAGTINAFSPNKELAQQFLEDYVMPYEGVSTLNNDRPLGAVANKRLMAELESNPLIAHTFNMAATGETMPDIPEMRRFWSSWESHLGGLAAGEHSVEPTLTRIAERLRRLDSMKMWSRRHYLTSLD